MAAARQRIVREIERLVPSPYYSIQPRRDNLLIWDVNIHALPVLHQYDKNYDLVITIPDQYPLIPPRVKVVNQISHTYIDSRTNEICSDILIRG